MARQPRYLKGELACPGCGNDALEVVSDGEQTNLLCHTCWSCWHFELGWMEPVSAATCPGCQYLAECLRQQVSGQGA